MGSICSTFLSKCTLHSLLVSDCTKHHHLIFSRAGRSGAAGKVGGEERTRQMRVWKKMTGGPKGKVVFSSSFELKMFN